MNEFIVQEPSNVITAYCKRCGEKIVERDLSISSPFMWQVCHNEECEVRDLVQLPHWESQDEQVERRR